MLPFCVVWFNFVALGDPFSSTTAFWWSLNWSLNRSLTVTEKLLKGHLMLYNQTVQSET